VLGRLDIEVTDSGDGTDATASSDQAINDGHYDQGKDRGGDQAADDHDGE
jgi:hypothetical protein